MSHLISKSRELEIVKFIKSQGTTGALATDLMTATGIKNRKVITSAICLARKNGYEIISKRVGKLAVYYMNVTADEIGASSTTTFISSEAKSLKTVDDYYLDPKKACGGSKPYYTTEMKAGTLIIHTNVSEIKIVK